MLACVSPGHLDDGLPDADAADAYGFPLHSLTPIEAAARRSCGAAETRHSAYWAPVAAATPAQLSEGIHALILTNPGFLAPIGWTQGRPRTPKDLIRRGVPIPLRPLVWLVLSGGARLQRDAGAGYYTRLHDGTPQRPNGHHATAEAETVRQIETDLPRTFPAHPWIASTVGQASLRRVLVALSRHLQLGYCQSWNYVAAFLLLVCGAAGQPPLSAGSLRANSADPAGEEAAFWVLAATVGDIAPPGTYDRVLSGCRAEMGALGDLVESKHPRLALKLAALGLPPSAYATDWIMAIFTRALPSETAARMWDGLLAEGSKVVHRAALAILARAAGGILAAAEPEDAAGALTAAARTAHDRDAFAKYAYAGVGSLSHVRLDRLRAIHASRIAAEANHAN